MSEDTDIFDEEASTDEDATAIADADGGEFESDTGRSLTEYVQWGLFAVLILLVLVSTFRFYFAASSAIDQLVTREYRSLFQMGFNLAILLVAGLGLSVLVRRMN